MWKIVNNIPYIYILRIIGEKKRIYILNFISKGTQFYQTRLCYPRQNIIISNIAGDNNFSVGNLYHLATRFTSLGIIKNESPFSWLWSHYFQIYHVSYRLLYSRFDSANAFLRLVTFHKLPSEFDWVLVTQTVQRWEQHIMHTKYSMELSTQRFSQFYS